MPAVELFPPRHSFVAASKVLANTFLKIVPAYIFFGELSKTKSFLLVHNTQIRAAAPVKELRFLWPPEIAQLLNRCHAEKSLGIFKTICTPV
jgi:hypothetical protein